MPQRTGDILVSTCPCVCVGGGGASRYRLETSCMDSSWKNSQLCEHLHTHKVFQKDQCFCLNYHKFSIKSYVLDVY